jgi:hypothetical protein
MTQPSERGSSPADRLISSLDGTFYKLSEAAQLVGRSDITLRRLIHKKKVKAPSYQIRQGSSKYYLFTPEDIEELKSYYGKQGLEKRDIEHG